MLACEFGAGPAHTTYLLAIACHLRAAGVECLATTCDMRRAADFAALGIHTVQGFVWPGDRRWVPHEHERPEIGPVDVLANLGLVQPKWVAAAIAHYNGLFALFHPAVVVGANAHGALLAARGRVPAIALGSSRLLPPAVDGRFPAFDPIDTTSSWADEEVLRGLNAGLRLADRQPLNEIADIFANASVLPFGPSALDPFTRFRSQPILPPYLHGVPSGLRAGSGADVFVHLRGFAFAQEAVLAALLSFRRPLRVLAHDLDSHDRELLSGAGIVIESERQLFPAVFERARAVIHHGDADLTATCLAGGLPQIILATDPEHGLAGRFVAREGVGEWSWLGEATTSWIVDAGRRAYDDEVLRAWCETNGARFAASIGPDPARAVAIEACGLLGIPAPPEFEDATKGYAGAGFSSEVRAKDRGLSRLASRSRTLLGRLGKSARRVERRGSARALLAWEYGGGHTHTSNILAVANLLRAAGVDCLAVLHDTRANGHFAALGIPTVQNYIWPHSCRWARHDRERTYAGFVDLLGNLGFWDPDAVSGALAHYDGLFAAFDPDLVLAENAYGAHLAARGRVRTLAFGFGQFLPPIINGKLAVSEAEPASWSDDEILFGLDEGLRRAGRRPIERLAGIFEVDAVLPIGPAAFDLNTPMRSQPALPVHVRGFRPGSRAGSGAEIFVYLQGLSLRMPGLLAALLAVGRPIRAHVLDLDPGDRAILLNAGILLEEDILPIEQIVRRSRCVLHHGGVGLTAVCLSAGLPQVILSKQLDNRVSGEFVAREGLGDHIWLWDATTAWIADAARRAYDDEKLQRLCRMRAPAFDAWFGPDPATHVAAEACRLLEVPPPSRSTQDTETRPGRGQEIR